jgi:dTMP kinase
VEPVDLGSEVAASEDAAPDSLVPFGGEPESRLTRVFGSKQFFRLWCGQVVSSLGDWIGLIAITALAARIGGSGAGAAVGLVLSARLIPGFIIGPVIGVVADRWDRRRLMMMCDAGRGLVLVFLPFVTSIAGLFLASLLLEVMTLMWSSAKEASVPNLVPTKSLSNANSLSLVAAYGTFPLGGAVFALLAGAAAWLGHYHALHVLRVNQERLAFWFDVLTFFTSALLVSTLRLPGPRRDGHGGGGIDLAQTARDLREGWAFIGTSPRVRAVIIGLATGLIGGGMIVPLGTLFSTSVLHGGTQSYGLYITALGTGVAIGVIALSIFQKRVPHERTFVAAIFVAGTSMIAAASVSSLGLSMLFVGGLGLAAGAVYVLGFTILQTNVEDELRGRTFATLYVLIRLCLLLALGVAPILAQLLDGVSDRILDGAVHIGGFALDLPGVRLTLWLGGLIVLAAGFLAQHALKGNGDG